MKTFYVFLFIAIYNRIGGNLFDFFEDVVIKYN